MNNRTLVLVGNPNSGKTTLFNGLTGSDQRIGNWPGVTVEKKQGSFCLANEQIEVIDLPGAYTLNYEQIDSLDERIAANYITDMQEGVLLNVVDASNLKRHLYLTIQL
jgi:ferrous iron transport protein B